MPKESRLYPKVVVRIFTDMICLLDRLVPSCPRRSCLLRTKKAYNLTTREWKNNRQQSLSS